MQDGDTDRSQDTPAVAHEAPEQEPRAARKAFVTPEAKRYALPEVTYGSFIW